MLHECEDSPLTKPPLDCKLGLYGKNVFLDARPRIELKVMLTFHNLLIRRSGGSE